MYRLAIIKELSGGQPASAGLADLRNLATLATGVAGCRARIHSTKRETPLRAGQDHGRREPALQQPRTRHAS